MNGTVLDDWLRAQDSRTILEQQAGALADDEYVDELLAMIYRDRQRSETDEDEVVLNSNETRGRI